MRDVGGNPVLGVYGGEAASKSWGGFSLAVGDLVIGRNALDAAAIMWDQSTGKFGFYGGGNSTPQVEIGTDGQVLAGAGAVRLGGAGLYVYPVGSVLPAAGIDEDGFWMNKGGPRTTVADWSTGARLHSALYSELYEADSETFTAGGATTTRTLTCARSSPPSSA